jgi:hypothetical protein
MPIEEVQTSDSLETLKLEVGEKFKGILVDIDQVEHMNYDNPDERELDKRGKPKWKWVARLRLPGAVDPDVDLKWWTQNQIKFELSKAIAPHHPNNYRGAEIGIERLEDMAPRRPGYKGAQQYRVVIITPGPTNWVDPLMNNTAIDIDTAGF